jgi:hypothetical protein
MADRIDFLMFVIILVGWFGSDMRQAVHLMGRTLAAESF